MLQSGKKNFLDIEIVIVSDCLTCFDSKMNATPSNAEKRGRESPGLTSPLCKQTKMADTAENFSSGQSLSDMTLNDRMDKMFELLTSLKKGQESLQKIFDSKIERLRRDVLSTIDDKIKAVKVDIDLQFAGLDKRIADLEIEMISLKSHNGLQQDKSVKNCDITIIGSNLRERPGKSPLDDANDLISALGTDISSSVKITDASRCTDRHTGKPPLLKIAFENADQKIDVLRAKKKLKSVAAYKDVYIFGSKTHTERILELNAKTLLSQIPNGNQFRVTGNGRIVKKDSLHQNSSGRSDSGGS